MLQVKPSDPAALKAQRQAEEKAVEGKPEGWQKLGDVAEKVVADTVEATIADRGKTHGDWTTQAATAEAIKNAMHKPSNWQYLTPGQREALDIIAVKIARILTGNPNERDHWHDIAGYARLVERELTNGH